jgi:hypothetical protein
MFGDSFAPKDFADCPRPFLSMTIIDLRQLGIGFECPKSTLDGSGADVQVLGDPFDFPSLDPTESCQFG